MPLFAPRGEPVKKKEELAGRKQILINAILHNLEFDKITKKAENYRNTRLLLNKAILHVIREKDWQKKKHIYDKEKVLEEIEIWKQKSVQEIINEIKVELKLNNESM